MFKIDANLRLWATSREGLKDVERLPGAFLEAGAKSRVLGSTKRFNLGFLFEAFLTPWRYPESFMEFPDCKECHILRLLVPDLILDLILDLPKCAEQCSRCSLSLVFTF